MNKMDTKSPLFQELLTIIFKVREKITDSSDVIWAGYDSPVQLRNELDFLAEQLQQGNEEALVELHGRFLPTGVFQELSISNGWDDEYLRLAEQFDKIYSQFKNNP